MSIQSTRNGFYYQDLYAVVLFLSKYSAKKQLVNFFVEFEYDVKGQKSYDIKLEYSDGDTIFTEVYEVKTGEAFKDSGKEVFNVVIEYIRLRNSHIINEKYKTTLVLCKDEGKAVRNFQKNALCLASDYGLLPEEARKALAYFKKNLPKTGIYKDDKELHGQIKSISFEEGDPIDVNGDETTAEIGTTICNRIQSIAKKIGIKEPNSTAFPEEILMNKLLGIIQHKAGLNEDLVPLFKGAMADFYMRQKFTTPAISSGDGGGIDKARSDVIQAMEKFEGRVTVDTIESNPAVLSEGSTIQTNGEQL